MRIVTRAIAGLIAGAVGAYAGLFALLSATGLDEPEWAPVTMLIGAALFGSVTVGLLARLEGSAVVRLTGAAVAIGAVGGLIIRALQDGYEWTIVAGVALVVALALTTDAMETAATEPEQRRRNTSV